MLTNENIKQILYNYKKIDKWIADGEKELELIREKNRCALQCGR